MTTDQNLPDPEAVPEVIEDAPEQPKAPPPPPNFFDRRPGRILLYSSMGLFGAFLLVAGIFYLKFSPKVNDVLDAGPFFRDGEHL